jgi:transcriptional regulator with XRE-family HTH domain
MSSDRTAGPASAGQGAQRLGESIRELRLSRSLSPVELAQKAGVSPDEVGHIERGDGGSVGGLVRIVAALGRGGWLTELAPDAGPAPAMSPLQRVRERQAEAARKLLDVKRRKRGD